VKIRKEAAMKPMMASLLVGLILVGCAAGMSSEQPGRSKDPQIVVGRTWKWVSTVTPVEKITAAAPERYTILLQEDGNVRVRFDCNKGRGKYTLSEGRISFGPLMSTRMACPPDTQDASFMRDLQRVASFFIERGELYLELPVDSGTMRFRQAP
jgi:heat shock protein HslJ